MLGLSEVQMGLQHLVDLQYPPKILPAGSRY